MTETSHSPVKLIICYLFVHMKSSRSNNKNAIPFSLLFASIEYIVHAVVLSFPLFCACAYLIKINFFWFILLLLENVCYVDQRSYRK